MRRVIPVVVGAVLLSWLAVPVLAEVKTIRGEVVDSVCFMKDSARRGEAHAKCAMSCAQKGNQMAIATSDGLYLVSGAYTQNNNAKLVDFVAKNVDAKGEVSQADGHWHIDVASMSVAK